MSHLNKTSFQLSVLAAAMLSLSACATTPALTKVGNGIDNIGSKTAEAGSNAWEGTKNLLNIGSHDSEQLDEVDLALMEEDADLQNQANVEVAAIESQPLLPQGDSRPSLSNMDSEQQVMTFGEVPEAPSELPQAVPEFNPEGEVVVLASANNQQPVIMSDEQIVAGAELTPNTLEPSAVFQESTLENVETVASEDLPHEVQEGETLWIIAKKTTGDANNWHVIADINNLAPDASVSVGQKIMIPADMVKSEYAGQQGGVVVAESDTSTAPALEQPEAVAAVALEIPEKSSDEQHSAIVVAAAEQITPAAPSPDAVKVMADATALKVGAGETLWDFAKRTTGDATNWKMIAEKNQFSEQQIALVRSGQKILVPADLVRFRDENGVLIAQGEEGNAPTAIIGGAVPTNETAIDASAAVLAGTNTPKDGEIKIVEAAYQADSAVKPVTAESLAQEAEIQVAKNDGEMGKVMVKGTYYPKAVYNQADFSSSLLMRVSPGTQLLVSKAIGPWLEVQTDQGVGYVHSRDIK